MYSTPFINLHLARYLHLLPVESTTTAKELGSVRLKNICEKICPEPEGRNFFFSLIFTFMCNLLGYDRSLGILYGHKYSRPFITPFLNCLAALILRPLGEGKTLMREETADPRKSIIVNKFFHLAVSFYMSSLIYRSSASLIGLRWILQVPSLFRFVFTTVAYLHSISF